MKKYQFCNKDRNKLSVFVLILFSLAFYSFTLFTSGLEPVSSKAFGCVALERWFNLVKLMAFIDTFITMFFPFVIIFLSNISIVWKLMKFKTPFTYFKASFKSKTPRNNLASLEENRDSIKSHNLKHRPLRSRSTLSASKRPNYPIRTHSVRGQVNYKQVSLTRGSSTENVGRKISIVNFLSKSAETKRLKKYSRTTRMLLIVSTTFLILHSPIAFCKIWYFIKSFTGENLTSSTNNSFSSTHSYSIYDLNATNKSSTEFNTSSSEEILERISCYIYYLNFSLNFFLYALNGPKFRKAILNLFTKKNYLVSRSSIRSKSTVI